MSAETGFRLFLAVLIFAWGAGMGGIWQKETHECPRSGAGSSPAPAEPSPDDSPTAHIEAAGICYENVAYWVKETPQLRSAAAWAMIDDKLTEEEYEALDKRRDYLLFAGQKQELLDACMIKLDEETASKPAGPIAFSQETNSCRRCHDGQEIIAKLP